MKKFQIVLLLTTLINTISFGQLPVDTSNHQDKTTAKWQSLSDDQYEIKYPSTWKVNKSGQMGTSFILFSPLSNKSDNFKENINLLIQDLAGYDLTLDQYAEISEGQIKTMVTDGQIILSERIKEKTLEYQKVIYSGKQGIYNLKYEQFYWLINDKAYVLTLTCKETEFDNYQEMGEKILESFEIKIE